MFRQFLALFLFCTSLATCSQMFDLADVIRTHQPESVAFYHDSKVFLKPDHIRPTHEGMFLISPTSMIPLSRLHSCADGCYVQSGDESITPSSVYVPITCGNCGFKYWYSPAQPRCPNCGYSGH